MHRLGHRIQGLVELWDDGNLGHGDTVRGDGVYTALASLKPDLVAGRRTVLLGLADETGKECMARGYVWVHPVSDQVVYDDGWEDWSPIPESACVDLFSTQEPYSGGCCMSLQLSSGGYVDFIPPGQEAIHTYGYVSIELALNPGMCGTFYPRIYVGTEGGGGPEAPEQVSLATPGLGAVFTQGQWTQVSIPLGEMDMVNRTLAYIRLGGYCDSTFQMDNLRLVADTPEKPGLALYLIPLASLALLHACIHPDTARAGKVARQGPHSSDSTHAILSCFLVQAFHRLIGEMSV